MTESQKNETKQEVEAILGNLVGIGTSWARYGLTVGRSALETSAKTLTSTAEVLGQLAKQFEEKAAKAETQGKPV